MVRLGEVSWDEVKLRSGEVNSIQASCIISTLTACRPNRLKAPSLARRCRSSGNTEEPSRWAAENTSLFFPFLFFTTRPRASASYLPGPAFCTCMMTANPFRLRGTTTLPPLPTTRHRRRTTQSQQRGWRLRGKNKQTNKTQECVSINQLDNRRVEALCTIEKTERSALSIRAEDHSYPPSYHRRWISRKSVCWFSRCRLIKLKKTNKHTPAGGSDSSRLLDIHLLHQAAVSPPTPADDFERWLWFIRKWKRIELQTPPE